MDTKNFDVSPYVNSIKDTLAKILHVNNAAQDEIKNLREELNYTTSQLSKTTQQLDATTRELSNTKLQLDATTHRLENTTRELENTKSRLNDATAQIEDYAEKYADIEQAYNSYKKLSDTTKFALEGIFGDATSPTNFLVGALPEDNLKSLFDYVATAMNSGNNPAEIDILHGIFEFAFNAANTGRREKIFTRLNTSSGNIFDDEEMRKTSNSAQSGAVQKVLLEGYKFSRTGKIIKPSLVVIG